MRKFNWQIWAGFLLSVFAFLSYPLLFVRFAGTRDFPWANLVLFALAAALTLLGVRRAFAPDRPRPRLAKVGGTVLATLSVVVLGFLFFLFSSSRAGCRLLTERRRSGKRRPTLTSLTPTGNRFRLQI